MAGITGVRPSDVDVTDITQLTEESTIAADSRRAILSVYEITAIVQEIMADDAADFAADIEQIEDALTDSVSDGTGDGSFMTTLSRKPPALV